MGGVPPVIPDYELLRPIGRGGYGEVWLARGVTGIYRAAKIVYRANFEDARPFEREFAGIQRFEPLSRAQENQITILHVGRNESAGYFYYVMELADDAASDAPAAESLACLNVAEYKPKTLKEVLRRSGRLSVIECLPVVLGLCNALDHLHRHGLIHRDVKPSNIIFVNGQPKLADLGLVSNEDATRSFVGTEGYVPREGSGSRAADLFSLGKVLYEASTGRSRNEFPLLPLDLETMRDRAAFLELNEVVVKACADDPDERYGSAEEMRAELLLIQAGKSVRRLHSVERQVKRLVPAGVGLSLVAGAAIWIQHVQTSEIRHRAQVESEFRRRAEEQTLATKHLLYAADMNLVQQAYGVGDFGRARSLLRAHLPQLNEPDLRGFEWRYFWHVTEGQQQHTLSGHTNAVRRAAYSPDGRFLVSASYDGTVRLWDVRSHKVLASFSSEAGVREAAFSCDGERVLFFNEIGTLECRDVATGAQLFQLRSVFGAIAISPREDIVAACTPETGSALNVSSARTGLYESRSGRELDSIADSGSVLTFSPDGNRLAVGSAEKRRITVWDLARRRVLTTFDSHEARFDLCFSPDGEWLAQGDAAGTLRLWDMAGNLPPKEVRLHEGSVWQVAFSPDGRTIATTGTDQTLRLLNRHTLAQEAVFRGHNGEVWGVAFSPDGKQIATASKDETIRIWNSNPTAREEVLTRNVHFWEWPILSEDGTLVAVGERRNVVKVWRTTDGVEMGSVTNAAHPFAFGDGGREVWAFDGHGSIRLFPLDGSGSSRSIRIGGARASPIRACAFDPGKGLLAIGHQDGTIRLVDIAAETERKMWKAHSGNITSLAFSVIGDDLASTSADELDARLWGTNGVLRRELRGHKLGPFHAAFSPDGRYVATASPDDTCRVWETISGMQVAVLDDHKGGAYAAAFAPDGKTLAVATGSRQVRLWNLKTFRDMGAIETEPAAVFFARFTSDGRTLATVSYHSEHRHCSLRLLRTQPAFPSHPDSAQRTSVLEPVLDR